jgi:hypothetical protein
MESTWESDVATLLSDLSAVQADSLSILGKKREMLAGSDLGGLAALAPQEEALVERLQRCLERREVLLARARSEGRPWQSLRELACSLPRRERGKLLDKIDRARAQARILTHQSLTNWVVVQRTLIHLSQMLEIIATGGRVKPTYRREGMVDASGALVDREV